MLFGTRHAFAARATGRKAGRQAARRAVSFNLRPGRPPPTAKPGRQIFIIEPRQERPAAGVEPRRSLRGIAAELAGAGHVNPATNKPYSAEAIRLALAGAKEAA